tara:strand:- start:503 stop:709 length:207 start_codon:yes stop_codon:yes gene_type:complete
MGKEIINIQGKLFQVKRKFKEKRINLDVEDGVKVLKQYYHCDTMFKAQGFLWLCNEIKDIEYEETKNE